jgi:hypothetical protein
MPSRRSLYVMIEISVCFERVPGAVTTAAALPLLVPRIAPCITGRVDAVTSCAFACAVIRPASDIVLGSRADALEVAPICPASVMCRPGSAALAWLVAVSVAPRVTCGTPGSARPTIPIPGT